MNIDHKPLVAITMGDPAGIGPEVTAKALTDDRVYERCRPFVIGNIPAMDDALRLINASNPIRPARDINNVLGQSGTVDVLDLNNLDYGTIAKGKVSAAAGGASVEWVLKAGELAAAGHVQAIVTAPINKKASSLAGYKDVGHMELLQQHTGAGQVATMLMTPGLRVVHLTTHRSLRVACAYVTKDRVLSMILLTNSCFQQWGFPSPRIGVASLNPHASDEGLLGDEEEKEITPAVIEACSRGLDAEGPIAADTVFNRAIDGHYDVVIAMYHDQGHIPIKVHNWAKSITLNLGFPFIRTSVDHGTAFDIAGRGIADHKSMLEAIRVAVDLAGGSRLK